MAGALHQLVAGYSPGDAISNEARLLREAFRSWGLASNIFCESRRTHPRLRTDALDISSLPEQLSTSDVVLLHLSIGSPANILFRQLRARKVVRYHNITPPEYFDIVNKEIAHALALGRRQMALLADTAEINMGVSRYNVQELASAGYRDPQVVPLLLDLDAVTARPDPALLAKYSDGRTNVVFVGRCAPNKKIEDLLQAMIVFRKAIDADARLIHVGSFAGTERYHYMLRAMAKETGLTDVVFTGSVPQSHVGEILQQGQTAASKGLL